MVSSVQWSVVDSSCVLSVNVKARELVLWARLSVFSGQTL